MSKKKKILIGIGIFIGILGILSFIFPVIEVHGYYCFYCGKEKTSVRFFGIPCPAPGGKHPAYQESIEIPEHAHYMIDSGGVRLWANGSDEAWDEFGWTGSGPRGALLYGVRNHPDKSKEIISEYMAIDPANSDSRHAFCLKYGNIKKEGNTEPEGSDQSDQADACSSD